VKFRAFDASESLSASYGAPEEEWLPEVKGLLDRGANPNHEFNGGLPLEDAVEFKYFRVFALLLDRGAKIDKMDPHFARMALQPEYWKGIQPALVARGMSSESVKNALVAQGEAPN
jgi:hypothetical protein